VNSKGRCEPNAAEQDPHQTRGQTANLVTALIAKESKIWPSALETIEQTVSTVLLAVNRKETRESAFLCSFDRILLKTGIECGCSDFACVEYLEARVECSMRQHQVGKEVNVMCSKKSALMKSTIATSNCVCEVSVQSPTALQEAAGRRKSRVHHLRDEVKLAQLVRARDF